MTPAPVPFGPGPWSLGDLDDGPVLAPENLPKMLGPKGPPPGPGGVIDPAQAPHGPEPAAVPDLDGAIVE